MHRRYNLVFKRHNMCFRGLNGGKLSPHKFRQSHGKVGGDALLYNTPSTYLGVIRRSWMGYNIVNYLGFNKIFIDYFGLIVGSRLRYNRFDALAYYGNLACHINKNNIIPVTNLLVSGALKLYGVQATTYITWVPQILRITLSSGTIISVCRCYGILSVTNRRGGLGKDKHRVVKVRGIAKNPVDHPNGGRSNTKGSLRTPWGSVAKYNK